MKTFFISLLLMDRNFYNNLSYIIQLCYDTSMVNKGLLLQKHQNEFDRKARLQNKTLGYLLLEISEFLSALALFTITLNNTGTGLSKTDRFWLSTALFSILYFLVWSLGIASRYYKNQLLMTPDIETVMDADLMEQLKVSIENNKKINDKIAKYNDVLFLFMLICTACFTIFCTLAIWMLAR